MSLRLALLLLPMLVSAMQAAPVTTPNAADNAVTATAIEAASNRLVGEWTEYSPEHNEVDFHADGHVRLHLRRGEVGNLRALDGRWRLLAPGRLQLHFNAGSGDLVSEVELRFDGEEMLLVENGTITRHRRRQGGLPGAFRW